MAVKLHGEKERDLGSTVTAALNTVRDLFLYSKWIQSLNSKWIQCLCCDETTQCFDLDLLELTNVTHTLFVGAVFTCRVNFTDSLTACLKNLLLITVILTNTHLQLTGNFSTADKLYASSLLHRKRSELLSKCRKKKKKNLPSQTTLTPSTFILYAHSKKRWFDDRISASTCNHFFLSS